MSANHKTKILIMALSVAMLSGCSTLARIVDYGAAANSEAVEASVFTLCEGASVGSIRRQFTTAEEVETWKRLCNSKTEFSPQ